MLLYTFIPRGFAKNVSKDKQESTKRSVIQILELLIESTNRTYKERLPSLLRMAVHRGRAGQVRAGWSGKPTEQFA